MPAQPNRHRLTEETKALIKDAMERPVLVEIDGASYEVNARSVDSSPLTAEEAYASLPPRGDGLGRTDEDLETIIHAANEENARRIMHEID